MLAARAISCCSRKRRKALTVRQARQGRLDHLHGVGRHGFQNTTWYCTVTSSLPSRSGPKAPTSGMWGAGRCWTHSPSHVFGQLDGSYPPLVLATSSRQRLDLKDHWVDSGTCCGLCPVCARSKCELRDVSITRASSWGRKKERQALYSCSTE